MLIKIRQNSVPYYRLLFIALFLLLGVTGIGIAALDYFAGISLIASEYDVDHEAFHATSFIIGVIGFFNASLMTYLLKEKRSPGSNRRSADINITFPDRRITEDRRSTQ